MSDLKHHGVKGMKWGVRRYQNENGKLTAEGRARLKQDIDKANEASKAVNKIKEARSAKAKKVADDKIKEDLSNLSDQDLQKIVNRLNMEERYKQVMNSRAAEDGQNRVGKILEYAGTVLTVGASAATLYLKMQEMKNK